MFLKCNKNIWYSGILPKTYTNAQPSSEDRLAAVIEDLKEVLKHPHPKIPFLDKGTTLNDAIEKLETIFGPPKKDHTTLSRVNRVKPQQLLRNNWPPSVAKTNWQRSATIAKEPTIHPIGTVIKKNRKSTQKMNCNQIQWQQRILLDQQWKQQQWRNVTPIYN